MVAFDIILLVCSLWMGYQALAFNGVLIPAEYYVCLLGNSNIFIGVIKIACVKWSLVFAVIGVVLVVLRHTLFRNDSDSNILPVVIFYFIYSMFLLL